MNSVFAKILYTGRSIVSDAWLVFDNKHIVELISRKNAEILGIQNSVGTLEPGKWASFICWNGDPFHLTSYPDAVYGEGKSCFTDQ